MRAQIALLRNQVGERHEQVERQMTALRRFEEQFQRLEVMASLIRRRTADGVGDNRCD
jgi:hypothetical protein